MPRRLGNVWFLTSFKILAQDQGRRHPSTLHVTEQHVQSGSKQAREAQEKFMREVEEARKEAGLSSFGLWKWHVRSQSRFAKGLWF